MPPLPVSNADRARHGIALIEQGNLKAAERLLKDVLKADPGQFEALLGLGVLCGMRGQDAEAVKHLTRAARRNPRSDAAQYNLGQALIRLGRHAEAADALTAAAGIAELPHIHEKLGDCLRQLGRLDATAHHYARAVDLSGARAGGMLLSSLVEAKRRICDWTGLAELEGRLVQAATRGEAVEPLLLTYVTDDAQILRRNAETYATRFLPGTLGAAASKPRFQHTPRKRERLRVGYLCSDFRQHATAHLIAELLERHDRSRVEVLGLSFGPDDRSAMRKRLAAAVERLVDLSRFEAQEIARRIHGLGIDVLVDLNGYIANAQPAILMARPAPVQCHWLAFPGTLGAPWIDWHIVDPVVAPPGAEAHFTEALARLPDSYQPNDSRREVAAQRPSRAACGLPENTVVLASFNNSIKLSPASFASWMRVLAAVPDAMLWLWADNAWAPERLRAAAVAAGVAPERIVLADFAPPAEHLARLANADLLLDSFPYGAHTTASDALWMGVPVLTQTGRAFQSRVGASLLTAAGLPELIQPTADAWEREAIALALDRPRLASLKARLSAGRSASRLFDTSRLARHLENAYAEMWRRWCAGESPASFDVA
jgi:protein O-GlcNAc transferase